MSLDESIDTSTPVGRFFYTLIAAMAEWERAEIGSRIKASVETRAKLGRPLGGKAPFGYKWENKELVINPEEAPIRKLIYDLFLKHKRKRTVARILNEQGYRATKNAKFSGTSVDRMLRDPVAKGIKRINFTESLDNQVKLKPKEDWVFIQVPRIISDELWSDCNKIIDELSNSRKKIRRRGVHIFSGIVQCGCGTKMYMRTNSPKYICLNCKNKISPNDLEDVFHGQLENFLFSDTEIQNHLNKEKVMLMDKEELLDSRKKELQKLIQKLNHILELYTEGNLTKESFKSHHNPVYEKQTQIELSIMELQGEIDALKFQSLDNSQTLHDAQNLHKHWNNFTNEEKKGIIETITKSIIVGKEDIEINLSYIPIKIYDSNKPEKTTKTANCRVRNNYLSKTIQLCDTTISFCFLQIGYFMFNKHPGFFVLLRIFH